MFSEIVDIEEIMSNVTVTNVNSNAMEIEHAKPTSWTLKGVMIQYGMAQVVSSLVGSFGIIPSVATSHAMFGVSKCLVFGDFFCVQKVPLLAC